MAQVPVQVEAYQNTFCPLIDEFIASSKAVGEPLATLSLKVKDAFDVLLGLIEYGLSNRMPQQDNSVFQPLSNAILVVVEYKKREDLKEFANHISTVRESIVALGWISTPTPAGFVRDMKEAGEYYSNRVLSSFKGNEQHINWVSKWSALMTNLHKYVTDHFRMGFTWGSNMVRQPRGALTNLPVPPPPPPPPSASGTLFIDPLSGGDQQARQAMLSEINQGVHIMTRLRPVSGSDPAPCVRAQPIRGTIVPSVPLSKVKPVHLTPVFHLDGRKWVVEHQYKNNSIRIDNEDKAQCLSMFKCEDSIVQVMNKMNSVVVDNCKRTTLVVQDIISSVELIRCERVKIECSGHVPLVSLDNCDSIQVFVSKNSRNVELISSKSTSLNVCLLEDDGDYKELPIPEQIKTVIVGNKLVSSTMEKN